MTNLNFPENKIELYPNHIVYLHTKKKLVPQMQYKKRKLAVTLILIDAI